MVSWVKLVNRPTCLRTGRRAAGQGAELVQVDRVYAVRLEIGVDEVGVALLIVGVVVDVLVHVLVQHGESLGVRRVTASTRYFAVLDPAELVVLLPQVGLEKLGRSQELENRHVPFGEAVTLYVVPMLGVVFPRGGR